MGKATLLITASKSNSKHLRLSYGGPNTARGLNNLKGGGEWQL